MRCLCSKLFLSLLALFITVNTFALTTFSFDQLRKRIVTHPSIVRNEVVIYRKQALENHNQLAVGKAYYLLGELYASQADLPEAAKAYKKSLTIFKQLGNKAFEARVDQGIGSLYRAMENFDRALFFQRKNLQYQLKNGGQTEKADAYFNIASTKAGRQESDSAFYYYRVAEAIYQKEHNAILLSRVYLMTGNLYFSNGSNELALTYEHQALQMARTTQDKAGIQNALCSLGKIHRATGEIDSAHYYFLESLAYLDEVKNHETENEICKNLSEIYEEQDSLELSHVYLLRCKKLRYSLLTPEKIHQINAIDFGGEKPVSNSRLLWWLLVPMSFLITYFLYYILRKKPLSASVNSELPKHDELEARINDQQKELMTQTMRLQEQGELIERTKNELTSLDLNEQSRLRVRTLLSELKSTQQSSNWSEFERHFNDVHLDFYKKLMNDHPQLTVNERRLCGFISLNLSNKEISEITRKSLRSIEVAKYRLRQKMDIPKDGSLKAILTTYLS